MSRNFDSILISGASSGLGCALARHYAAPGVRLALGGRDTDRLAAVAAACRAAGAQVAVTAVDVTDAAATREWVLAQDEHRPLDLVIANAGISGETGAVGTDAEAALAARIYAVNVLGVLNTVQPLLPRLIARRAGQIGVMSSIAGYRGLPRGPAYSGSKAALIVHGEAWRVNLSAAGVGVSVICPGYVRTPLTARHRFKLPFLLEPEPAARKIAAGLAANRARIVFPWQIRVAAWMFRVLPEPWTRGLVRAPRSARGVPP